MSNSPTFDDLMASLGVRKLPTTGARPKKRAKAKTGSRTAETGSASPNPAKPPELRPLEAQTPEAQTPEAQTPEAQTPEAQALEVHSPEAQTSEARAPEAQTPEAQPRDQEPPAREPDQASEIQRLRQQLRETTDRLYGLEAELEHSREHRLSLERQLRGVTRAEAWPNLRGALAQRGIKGSVEATAFLHGLGAAHMVDDLLDHAGPIAPESFQRYLLGRVVLVCGRDHCAAPPPGRVVVPVAPGRCEACGGLDLPRAVRGFIDGHLIFGHKVAEVRGGPAWLHRVMREKVVHRVLSVRTAAGLPATHPVESDVDVLVLWGIGEDVEAIASRPTVLRVSAGSLAAMLDTVGSALKQAD